MKDYRKESLPLWWMAVIEFVMFIIIVMAFIRGDIVEGLLLWVVLELRSGFYLLIFEARK